VIADLYRPVTLAAACAALENEARPELYLPLGQIRRECQGRARCCHPATGKRRTRPNAVHVECRKARLETKQRSYFVVDAGKIGAVGNIESFGRQLETDPLRQFVLPAQAHIKSDKIGTKAAVARGANGPLVRRVIVAVDLASGE